MLAYGVALAVFLLLPAEVYTKSTYISENALLVNQIARSLSPDMVEAAARARGADWATLSRDGRYVTAA